MATDTIDQQFVKFIVESIVGNPEAVKVERTIDEKGVLLELTVAPDDLGRVIGKRGNTAQSIRTLLRALGTKNDARYNLKIVDVGGAIQTSAPVANEPTMSSQDDQHVDVSDTPTADSTNGSDAWAHLKSDDSPTSDEPVAPQVTEESSTDGENEESSVVEKTRKELEDLAGIDI